MPNTYTQLHVQFVFAVKYRLALINNTYRERLHQYITGTIQNDRHKMIQINSMPDHIHLLCGLRPHRAISDLMQKLKSESTKWINENSLCPVKFAWQEGYGAFSYSREQIHNVSNYIMNQEQHHKEVTFLEEYRNLLNQFEIEFQPQYLFHEPI
jgi:REP element-mobilizing transposase RayT